MREIKFLAWDSKYKKMHYKGFSLQSDGELLFDRQVLGEYSPLDFKVMQYIGRHDRDGKEIYEGDILQTICGCGYTENFPVCWRDGRNGYYLKATYQHNWDNDQLELKCTERDTKIIGNIYENLELLEVTK